MSQETLTPNPTEQPGMTPEQEQAAVDLVATQDERYAALNRHRNSMASRMHASFIDGRPAAGPTVLGSLIDDADHAIKRHQAKNAERAADKHFRQNEAAYYEQAVKEAEADGVEINR